MIFSISGLHLYDYEEFSMIHAIKSVVIATEDPVVINKISSILLQHNYSIEIEKSTTKSILKILEKEIEFLILDIDYPQNSNMDLIDIIRKMRPRLPIVVLSTNDSIETIRKLAQAVPCESYLLRWDQIQSARGRIYSRSEYIQRHPRDPHPQPDCSDQSG